LENLLPEQKQNGLPISYLRLAQTDFRLQNTARGEAEHGRCKVQTIFPGCDKEVQTQTALLKKRMKELQKKTRPTTKLYFQY
jgi:hypothetical protein